jgi:hypothetical protein
MNEQQMLAVIRTLPHMVSMLERQLTENSSLLAQLDDATWERRMIRRLRTRIARWRMLRR